MSEAGSAGVYRFAFQCYIMRTIYHLTLARYISHVPVLAHMQSEDILYDSLINDAELESEIGLTKLGVKEFHANVSKLREKYAGGAMSHI